MSNVYYSDYLQLDKILNAQKMESDKLSKDAHDEMLFIIVHQAYELWFKQVLYEVGSVMDILDEPVNDNSPALQVVTHRLNRVNEILHLLIHQIDVIETMTPLDFLDFRDLLRPASGFQSMQFKILEAKLGLKSAERYGKEYYVSQLREEDRKMILELDGQLTLIEMVENWLCRMPFFKDESLWANFPASEGDEHPFWALYRQKYEQSLLEGEVNNLKWFDRLFMGEEKEDDRKLSKSGRRSALFIMLFRGHPVLNLPYQMINHLLVIDELMATWRYRHMNMVHRMIGHRVGTGGSTGKSYLKNALDSHYIFSEFAELTSFLVERSLIPELSAELNLKLGFEQ